MMSLKTLWFRHEVAGPGPRDEVKPDMEETAKKIDVIWEETARKEYREWEKSDQRIVRRIDELLADIRLHPEQGLGKPEELHGELEGAWSRRIDEANRLVYVPEEGQIRILECKGHYSDEKREERQEEAGRRHRR